MTKAEAVIELLCAYSEEKVTKSNYASSVRAIKVLGLNDGESIEVLRYMDYLKNDNLLIPSIK